MGKRQIWQNGIMRISNIPIRLGLLYVEKTYKCKIV
jgi:hypothetical protein